MYSERDLGGRVFGSFMIETRKRSSARLPKSSVCDFGGDSVALVLTSHLTLARGLGPK